MVKEVVVSMMSCFNCNHRNHFASDRQCTACGKTCRKCEDTCHFEVRCAKLENSGKPKQQGLKGLAQGKRVYNIENNLSGSWECKELQHVVTGTNNGIVDLNVGGIDVKSILICSFPCHL